MEHGGLELGLEIMKRLWTLFGPVVGRARLAAAILAIGAAGVRPALAMPANSLVTIQILPGTGGGPLGPDGRHHDAFEPSSFSVRVGRPITLRIVNHDMMRHSVVVPALGLDVVARPAMMAKGAAMKPVTTTVTFTVKKPGSYRWHCTEPCDDGAGYWAMTSAPSGKDAGRPDRDGFMAGTIVAR